LTDSRSGFNHDDHWGHRAGEPNKAVICSIALARLRTDIKGNDAANSNAVGMAQKLLLFWRKPARRCWWEGVELDNVRGVEGKLKVWIRRVWTLEMVCLPKLSFPYSPYTRTNYTTERHWPALSVSSLHFLCISTHPPIDRSIRLSACLSKFLPHRFPRTRPDDGRKFLFFHTVHPTYIILASLASFTRVDMESDYGSLITLHC
jgi:hypothetical protein